MKKLFLAVAFVMGLAAAAMAIQTTIWLSSNTATADTLQNIITTSKGWGSGGSIRGILHGVCINTAAAGSIAVYNSSGTASNPITGIYSTATQVPCNFYDVAISSGLTYSKTGTADVTILYQSY